MKGIIKNKFHKRAFKATKYTRKGNGYTYKNAYMKTFRDHREAIQKQATEEDLVQSHLLEHTK